MKRRKKIYGAGVIAIGLLCLIGKLDCNAANLSFDQDYISPAQDGSYEISFVVEDEKPYAGDEFCISCSEGVTIEEASYNKPVSATAPTVARGYTWFGYYDSENSFSEPITVTMKVRLNPELIGEETPHLIVASTKTYRIEEEAYQTEEHMMDHLVYLLQIDDEGKVMAPYEEQTDESIPQAKNQTPMLIAGVTLILLLGGIFIYTTQLRRKRRKEE